MHGRTDGRTDGHTLPPHPFTCAGDQKDLEKRIKQLEVRMQPFVAKGGASFAKDFKASSHADVSKVRGGGESRKVSC